MLKNYLWDYFRWTEYFLSLLITELSLIFNVSTLKEFQPRRSFSESRW